MLSALSIADDTTIFSDLRAREFARLDDSEHVYADYTGSALYGASQLQRHHELLRQVVFGNPHSDSPASRASTMLIDAARHRLLRFFGVDESTHAVIFTANCTAAIKLVAESYPFSRRNALVLSADNHNSVNGVREYAARAGAAVRYLPLDDELRLREPLAKLADHRGSGGLFAFPAQSNFSGVLHPLSLIHSAHKLGFDVLLDAAAYVPSHALNLREWPADFVAMSFYKLFGYPTGLGALIARRDALARLQRPWFAGGTVVFASVAANTHRLRSNHDAFEDGTANFLGIAALDAGFDLLEEAQMPRITAHVDHLTALTLDALRSIRRVRIYGPTSTTNRGGTIAFNVLGLPYWQVESRARDAGISLRGGCFCNPGASEGAFGLDERLVRRCVERLGSRFTPQRFSECAETPVGAVRVSFGLANNERDVETLLDFLRAL